ncbi:hypothetical protein MBLNU13_g05550t1 [Cladosporium sp. NU13]
MAKKALVCFHGTGSKGQIFRVQLARLTAQLRDMFEFIYIDGPKTCAAGPGVLPTFAGEEPYYCWFAGHGSSMEDDLAEIDRAVQKGIKEWRMARREQGLEEDVEIVGGIGFSEGSLALAMMLWQQQQQANCTWPLRFAVLTCCFFPREASLWLHAQGKAAGMGEGQGRIDVPTVHVHGDRDFCLGRARKLVREHCHSNRTQVVTVDAAHHLPTQPADIARVVDHIRALAMSVCGSEREITSVPCLPTPLSHAKVLASPFITQTPVLATR